MYYNGIRIIEDFDTLRQNQFFDMYGLAKLQLANINSNRIRDGNRQTFHFDLVQWLV